MNQTIKTTVKLLERLQTRLFYGEAMFSPFTRIDVRPFAEEIGLDIDSVMEEIGKICDNRNYNVGWHMDCTRMNVLTDYRTTRKILLDRDHLEGLRQILRVEYGDRRDY